MTNIFKELKAKMEINKMEKEMNGLMKKWMNHEITKEEYSKRSDELVDKIVDLRIKYGIKRA